MIEGVTSSIQNALSGLQKSSARIEQSARNIAEFGTQGANTPIQDRVDLSAEAVNLIQAEVQFSANLASIDAASDLSQELLDVLGDDE